MSSPHVYVYLNHNDKTRLIYYATPLDLLNPPFEGLVQDKMRVYVREGLDFAEIR